MKLKLKLKTDNPTLTLTLSLKSEPILDSFYSAQGIVDDEGLCRFGWATRGANFNLGTDAFGYGFGSTGMKSHRGQFEKYGESFSKGDSVGCRLDLVKVKPVDLIEPCSGSWGFRPPLYTCLLCISW